MVDSPQLLGFLSSSAGPPKELLTTRLLSQLESDDSTGKIGFRTNPENEYCETEPQRLPEHLGDHPYVGVSNCRISGDPSVYIAFSIVEEAAVWGNRAPLIHATSRPAYSPAYIDTLVDFLVVLAEELPLEFLYLTHNGPYRPAELPDRGNFAEMVMIDQSFINILGPEAAAKYDRETLLSLPVYEVRELTDGGVLIRPFEKFEDWDSRKFTEIREHLGLDPFW